MTTHTHPPAGWYPDPHDPNSQRWFDGHGWTSHVVFRQAQAEGGGAGASRSSVVAPPRGSWGLPDIGWMTLFIVGALVAGVVIVVVGALINPEVFDGAGLDYNVPAVAWILVISQGVAMAGLAAWPLIVGRWKGDGWRAAFGFVVDGRAWWVGAVGGIATFIVLLVLTLISSLILGEEVDSAAAEVVSGMSEVTLAYAIFLVFIAIGAPFVEEISFRGLLWGAIVKRGWSPWIATAISGVAFGLFHFEPQRVVALIAAGFVLGVVRHYAGLAASMLAHCIVNSIGVFFLLLGT